MSTPTHATLTFTAPGPSFPHKILLTPTPTLAPNQVLIANRAVALNPLDYKRIAYNVLVNAWPTSGGFEVAGVVEAVGEDVGHVAVGDEVVALAQADGFAAKTCVGAGSVVRKPRGLRWEEAVALP